MDPLEVILFGSAARGDASDDSDIDLILVMETDDPMEEAVKARLAIGPVGVPVDVIVYTPEEFTERSGIIGSVVYNALNEGRVIHGTL